MIKLYNSLIFIIFFFLVQLVFPSWILKSNQYMWTHGIFSLDLPINSSRAAYTLIQRQVSSSSCFFSNYWLWMLCLFSDSRFGGASGYGSTVRSSSNKRDYDVAKPPRKLDLDGLTPFEKNFYVESP